MLIQLTKHILKMTTCSENIRPQTICFEKKRATLITGKYNVEAKPHALNNLCTKNRR